MKLYYDFLDENNYSTLRKQEREMLISGLKRCMCILKAPFINEPGMVTVKCGDYPSRSNI